jgi:hypothetical protein
MYLSINELGPTGEEPGEFIDNLTKSEEQEPPRADVNGLDRPTRDERTPTRTRRRAP